MIADLKPYAEYKESGLPWLGEVPSHWTVLPAFGAFKPNKARNIGMKEKTVLSLSYGRIVIKPAEKLHGLVPESFETYQIVDPGDIVLRTTDLQNDHTSLRVGMVRDRGIITSAYLALRALPGVSPDYGFQFLNVWDSSKAIYGYGSGLRQGLDFSHFKRMPISIPPPAERAAIVRFLNWANARLERTIRAKRKVIALLNEQKQAIIHRAVTRGLAPSVPLEESGVPWLGEIPKHWEVRRIKSLSLVKRGASPRPIADMRFFDETGEYAWVRIKDVTASKRYLETTTERLSDLGKSRSVPLEPGAIFLSIAGSVGKPIITRIKCCIHDGFVYFPQFNGNADFLSYVFSSGRVYDGLGKLGTQLNLNTETVGSIRVPWPPVVEQELVAAYLDSELRKFDIAISRHEREIDLLREYRTRLVADVVTGKLDVREAAARLPEEELLPDLAAADDEPDDLPIEEEDDA